MGNPLQVPILEDWVQDAELVLHELRKSGFEFKWQRVETEEDFIRCLEPPPDIILADYSMPQFDATRALEILRERELDVPFIIVSGTIGEEAAVVAMKAGANDFFAKSKLTRLISAVERELREAEQRRKRRKAEQELLRAQQHFAQAFQLSPVGITITTLDEGRYIAANDSFLRSMEYDRDEVIGRTSAELDAWVDSGIREHMVEALTQQGVVRNWEVKARTKSGKIRDALISLEVIDLDETPCLLGLVHDITERKRDEEALLRYNERLKTLHAIDQAILTARSWNVVAHAALQYFLRQGVVLAANIVAFDFEQREGLVLMARGVGDTPTETHHSLDAWSREDLAQLRSGAIQVIEEQPEVQWFPPGIHALQPTGAHAYLRVPLIAKDELIGALNLAAAASDVFTPEYRDIAREIADQVAVAIQQARSDEQIQRHAAELEQRVIERTAELLLAKTRVESILHHSSDAIILTDSGGLIQQTNPGFHELFGYDFREVSGLSLTALVVPEYVDAVGQALDAVVQGNQRRRVEVVGLHKDGTAVAADMVLAPMPEPEGERRNVICSVRDITERKRMEEELRRALDNERELNELKSRFVSIVSHEFRTPLTSILSSSQLLKLYRDRMTLDRQIEHLDKIETQVQRLTDLLNDVLTLSKADAVGLAFSPTPLDLEKFCRNFADEMQVITKTPHFIIFTAAGSCAGFKGDEKLLRQIVTNLLTNAIKYSPAGGRIQFDLIGETDQVIIRIKDEGLGIPEEDQKHLFEPFHRAKNVAEISGTGLGLPIVKAAVEAHGGTITLYSKVGEGTTFTVRLPLAFSG